MQQCTDMINMYGSLYFEVKWQNLYTTVIVIQQRRSSIIPPILDGESSIILFYKCWIEGVALVWVGATCTWLIMIVLEGVAAIKTTQIAGDCIILSAQQAHVKWKFTQQMCHSRQAHSSLNKQTDWGHSSSSTCRFSYKHGSHSH